MAKKKKDMCASKEAERDFQEANNVENVESGDIVPLLPEDFTARMRKMLTADEYEEFLSSYGKKRRFSLRINPLKVSRETFEALTEDFAGQEDSGSPVLSGSPDFSGSSALSGSPGFSGDSEAEAGRDSRRLSPVPWEPDGFYYEEELRPGRHPRHEAGMYYIQEASAMVPAVLCGAQPGERVLDLCAAPGGKSTKLGASLRGEGVLVANEIHAGRAKILSSNIERMGIRNAVVTNETPQRLSSRFPSYFDRIVVDAPCSGEGMFRKEEEALRHWSLENVRMCAERQMEILEEAAVMLRPGGTLVYSTCTFAPEENEGVIGAFLAAHPEYGVCRISEMPGVDMEGWGFEPGHPEWAQMPVTGDTAARPAEGNYAARPAEGNYPAKPAEENYAAKRSGENSTARPAEGNSSAHMPADERPDKGEAVTDERKRAPGGLDGTVRLWPHRLDGEGHFAAVLRKRGLAKVTTESAGDFIEEGNSESAGALTLSADPHPEKRKSGSRTAACPATDIFEKKKDKKIKRKKSGGGKSLQDSGLSQMLRLWREFRDDVLVPPAHLSKQDADSLTGEEDRGGSRDSFADTAGQSGVLFGEKNLLLFGESLYALPFPADTMSFEGMRVLRPGLQLGTAVKGRFVPAHSLGMALRREEVRRAVDLPGASPAAFAWFRGESIPLSADCENGWTLVLIDGCAAGWGKAVGAVLKNHYPKGLRRNMQL